MSDGGKGTIILYGMPAYGHVNSNLYFAYCLCVEGFRVIYYAMEPFREAVLRNGCEYRPYPLNPGEIDLSDGRKLLKLYRLILTYTEDMLPTLLREVEEEKPVGVIFDSLALWGRAVAGLISVPSFAFYSIVAVERVWGKSFFAYAPGFLMDFFKYFGELPKGVGTAARLKRRYGVTGLGFFSVLMNQGDFNLMGYSKEFQPGGARFGTEYLFLGQMSRLRKTVERNDFVCPEKPLIYISLGTVFNRNEGFWEAVAGQLGEDSPYQVVMVWDWKEMGEEAGSGDKRRVPDNFILRPFVDQADILRRADLFITAGGVNSIHEALYYKVPCLICPQQGEQRVNGRQFEKMGFGVILRDMKNLGREVERAVRLREEWDEKMRQKVIDVHVEQALELFQKLARNR